jgi:hypothetical protein
MEKMETLYSSLKFGRVRLEDLDPPEVITASGHYHEFWYPAARPETRARHEEMYLSQVESWFKSVNRRFDLGLNVVREGKSIVAYDQSGNKVASFTYEETEDELIRKRDLRGLLKLINEKVKEKKAFKTAVLVRRVLDKEF